VHAPLSFAEAARSVPFRMLKANSFFVRGDFARAAAGTAHNFGKRAP